MSLSQQTLVTQFDKTMKSFKHGGRVISVRNLRTLEPELEMTKIKWHKPATGVTSFLSHGQTTPVLMHWALTHRGVVNLE